MATHDLPPRAVADKAPPYCAATMEALQQDDERRRLDWEAEDRRQVEISQRFSRRDPETVETAGDRLSDAAARLMRQAARDPVCRSAYARAHRRYIAACNAYAAALAARRIAA